jgi:hypothetical protein
MDYDLELAFEVVIAAPKIRPANKICGPYVA